ncbi:hypothetical protein M0813_04264 [Anaeramoeba flamelloides]|uniref:Ribosomal protein S7 n=1 Tax=Anaeramoeba flamelloides TaxID=1746091 RepID=A0ABQ8XLQ8_9EUKA|nr:hypothetical protein M0813_04264 [Anaeramoeba flamelloides]
MKHSLIKQKNKPIITHTKNNNLTPIELGRTLLLLKNTKKNKVLNINHGRNKSVKKNWKRDLNLENFSSLNKEELKKRLTTKPKPNWGLRLFFLKKYNQNLVQGYPEYLIMKNELWPKKITINKKIFPLLIKLTRKGMNDERNVKYRNAYKSCQRGLIEWFRRKKFINKIKYARDKMIFIPQVSCKVI